MRRIVRCSWLSSCVPCKVRSFGAAQACGSCSGTRRGRGKRGGVRTIYYWAVEDDVCFMLYLFAKNEQGHVTQKQLQALARAVREEFK